MGAKQRSIASTKAGPRRQRSITTSDPYVRDAIRLASPEGRSPSSMIRVRGWSSKTRRPSAASTGWFRSTPSTMRTNQTPNGMDRASGPRMSRKKPTRCVGSSSVAMTSSSRRRTVMVARPAARRLRTQSTSPHGAQTQRLPPTSMIAKPVVRGRPLFRPRMVTSRLGPIGTPATRRTFRIGLKNRIRRGTRPRGAKATLLPSIAMCSGSNLAWVP